jgi:hypothetical protein
LDEAAAHRVGALLGKSGTSDVVDGSVVDLATTTSAEVLTTDLRDIERLATVSGKRVVVSRR